MQESDDDLGAQTRAVHRESGAPRAVVSHLRHDGVGQSVENQSQAISSTPSGGDAYIMKLVIHEMNARRLLRNCHRVRPGSNLLVVDRVIAPGDEADPAKFLDLGRQIEISSPRTRSASSKVTTCFAGRGLRATTRV